MVKKTDIISALCDDSIAIMTRRNFLKASAVAVAALVLPVGFTACDTDARPTGELALRFATASDTHYQGRQSDMDCLNDLVQWLNAEKQNSGLDLFVHCGDISHSSATSASELATVKAYLDKNLNMPWHAARGNHDFVNDADWQAIMGTSVNHALTIGKCGFIIGSSTDGVGGNPSCIETTWLSEQLSNMSNRNYTFFFSHIYPDNDVQGGEVVNQCPEVLTLLAATNNFGASYHGHMHTTDYIVNNGSVCYCFDGHSGDTWGTVYRGYRITEVFKNGAVYTYQYNPGTGEMVNSRLMRSGA